MLKECVVQVTRSKVVEIVQVEPVPVPQALVPIIVQ